VRVMQIITVYRQRECLMDDTGLTESSPSLRCHGRHSRHDGLMIGGTGVTVVLFTSAHLARS